MIVYVTRDKKGDIVGKSSGKSSGFPEKIDNSHPDVTAYDRILEDNLAIGNNERKIQAEIERITRGQAIKNLKQSGELPANFQEH